MKHVCVRELKDLVKVPDDKLRTELLEEWMRRWLMEVEFFQDVVDSKYLTSEYSDLIKTKLAQNIAEDLVESCVEYKTQKRRVSGYMLACRRKAKK